jgi:hypothetical protein
MELKKSHGSKPLHGSSLELETSGDSELIRWPSCGYGSKLGTPVIR